jgi:hypothetical protein
MKDFEKLGVFYLGRAYDLEAGKRRDDLVLYDSKDLVTHGVCVGMTGSGKTGLCLSILEEAAIDGVPVLAIDPKGDLGNLLLTFPNLAPEDFRPWVNEDDARREGVTIDQFAADQAATWTRGLAEWGQDGARIARLRAAADFAVYTPGSSAGLPISILRSLDAPPQALLDDRESFADRVGTTATSLLTLAGIDAEPNRSREHTLLTAILNAAWAAGRSLDLAGLIHLKDEINEPFTALKARFEKPSRGLKNPPAGQMITVMPDPKLPTAVIFRDSFFNGLQPFISEHFSRVVYVSDFEVNFDQI